MTLLHSYRNFRYVAYTGMLNVDDTIVNNITIVCWYRTSQKDTILYWRCTIYI